MDFFENNACILSAEEQQRLFRTKAVVVGAGGLGGFLLNGLTRLGVQEITVIDYDVFQPSNVNRQLFCKPAVFGESKAEVLAKCLEDILPVRIKRITEKLGSENAEKFLSGADVVFDCVDNVQTKLLLEKQCIKQCTPLIHGGVCGEYGQTAIIMGEPILNRLFKGEEKNKSLKNKNAVILPQVISGLQLNLFVKFIKNDFSANTVYYVDLGLMEMTAFKEN